MIKENQCYLCETLMNQSYLKFVKINKERLVIEICPECYHIFTFGTVEEKQDYILHKELNMRGIKII